MYYFFPDTKRRMTNRSGTVTVEFALVAPALFLMILGMIEVGRGFMVAHMLENVARVGAREGTLPGASSNDIRLACAESAMKQGMEHTRVTVLVNGKQIDAAGAVSGDRITVMVLLSVEEFSWVPGSQFFHGDIQGTYSLRRE